MRRLAQFITLGLLAALPAYAAELANLRNGFSIRHERHEIVGEMTRLYMDAAPNAGYVEVPTAEVASFDPAPDESAAPRQSKAAPAADLHSIVNSASDRHEVDADFIASVIRAESANNPRALSRRGAEGLMQLMPATAGKLGVRNSFDPAQNVEGGVRYLRELLLLYDNDMVKALAAYNAGPQRVQQYKGVPPYGETRAYVSRVISDYNHRKLAERRQAHTAGRGRPANSEMAQAAAPKPASD